MHARTNLAPQAAGQQTAVADRPEHARQRQEPHGRLLSDLGPGKPMNAAELRAAFDAPRPFTVGIEEEVMLLDPDTLRAGGGLRELLARPTAGASSWRCRRPS